MTETVDLVSNSSKLSKNLVGKVLSAKMDKTIVVQIERLVKHELYGKYIKRHSKMYVHDENNLCKDKVGCKVEIKSSRPLSKLKRWTLVKILSNN